MDTATPPVYKWFLAYCILMALIYLVVALMGIIFLVTGPDPEMSELEATIMGLVFLVMGLVFFAGYAVGPFLPRKSWAWVYGMVLICIGLTSACCLPACIPMLIFWLKPELKAFFGRELYVPPITPPPPPQWG
jgi:drug/metabolite transporter (DMT)-like permease